MFNLNDLDQIMNYANKTVSVENSRLFAKLYEELRYIQEIQFHIQKVDKKWNIFKNELPQRFRKNLDFNVYRTAKNDYAYQAIMHVKSKEEPAKYPGDIEEFLQTSALTLCIRANRFFSEIYEEHSGMNLQKDNSTLIFVKKLQKDEIISEIHDWDFSKLKLVTTSLLYTYNNLNFFTEELNLLINNCFLILYELSPGFINPSTILTQIQNMEMIKETPGIFSESRWKSKTTEQGKLIFEKRINKNNLKLLDRIFVDISDWSKKVLDFLRDKNPEYHVDFGIYDEDISLAIFFMFMD